MDLQSIYISNGTGMFVLLMLCYISRAKLLRRRLEDVIYSVMVFGIMAGCFMEAFSYTLDGWVFPGSRLLNYAANTYLYFANLLMPFCVLVYVDLGLYGDWRRILKNYRPQIVIGLFMYAMNLVNFFIPVSYYISEQNVYERRPFSYVYYFVILYYCLSGVMVTRRYERENGARAFFNIGMFLFPVLVGAGLQFMFYGLSLAWLSSAVGLVNLYMMQQNELAYIDSLVDTYNRLYMNHVLSVWTRRGKSFSGIMLDVDHFKTINDSFGHSEGDRALKTVTDILKRARRNGEWVFRYAGDEFVVLGMERSEADLADYMAEVERLLAEHNRAGSACPLSLSYGICAFEAGDTDAFMKRMDSRMYEMKASHHRGDGI